MKFIDLLATNLSKPAPRLCTVLLLFPLQCAVAQEGPEIGQSESGALREAYENALGTAQREQEMALASVERARAEMARARESAERAAADQEVAREEQRLEREEIETMRRELSRAQEELRRASREVVRVHRELDRTRTERGAPPVPDTGRRAIIGVVLGDSNEHGVTVLGVSPDGPAERAGIKQGDVIVAMMGTPLAGDGDGSASRALLGAMEDVQPGDELDITVLREGGEHELRVTAQAREPVSWTSLIRLPSAPRAPGLPSEVEMEERMVVPSIDKDALAQKMAQLQEELSERHIVIARRALEAGDAPPPPEVFEFEFRNMSELGEEALHSASVWFGLPMMRGLKLAEVSPGLGEYFKTDRGVLVLSAEADNELQLQSGDVLLAVDGEAVERPADIMRKLRGLEAGTTLEIEIMRKRKNRTLDVIVPEHNKTGMRFAPEFEHEYHYQVEVESD